MLSTKKAGEILGVTAKTIYLWILAGKINAIKLGKNYKISEDEIEYIKKNGLREG